MTSRHPSVTVGLALALVVGLLSASVAQQNTSPESARKDNDELRAIYQADQAARENLIGTVGNEAVTTLMNADRMRRARVLELSTDGGLNTGADYYHAAMILQHGEDATDSLLAHELAVAAIVLGDTRAISLAAAAEDRFLRRIGRSQRFGTQFSSARGFAGPWTLDPIEEGVTDALRKVMNRESLSEAERRLEMLNDASKAK